MIGRLHRALGLLVAMSLLIILVSPAVPSWPTTMCSRHIAPTMLVMAHVPIVPLMQARFWQPVRELLVLAHSPDVVDLTSARLC